MRSKRWLVKKIVLPVYRQMYRESEPSVDFDELCDALINAGKVFDWNIIKAFYLPHERQQEILDEFTKKYKLTKLEAYRVRKEVYLGCSPRAYKGD